MLAMGVVMIQDNKDILQRLESYLSNPLQPFDYALMQEAYNEIMSMRRLNRAESYHWREATYHLAHMLSRLDGGADADKFAVEAYEATSTCYCEIENQVYCHIHW